MRRIGTGPLIWFVILFAAGLVRGDHCPEENIAAGASEHLLAGLDVTRAQLPEVIRALGRPNKHQEGTFEGDPHGSGWGQYKWKHGATVVKVLTEFYTSETAAKVESIGAIEISGARSGIKGTGKGLKLADTEPKLTGLYGTRFVRGTVNGPELGLRTLTYCFEDEIELSVGLDSAGRIAVIRLLAPNE
jgi:hypothetical protein